jgi:hypothetical protein
LELLNQRERFSVGVEDDYRRRRGLNKSWKKYGLAF